MMLASTARTRKVLVTTFRLPMRFISFPQVKCDASSVRRPMEGSHPRDGRNRAASAHLSGGTAAGTATSGGAREASHPFLDSGFRRKDGGGDSGFRRKDGGGGASRWAPGRYKAVREPLH